MSNLNDEQGYITIFIFVILISLGILIPLVFRLSSNQMTIAYHHQQQLEEYYLVTGLAGMAITEAEKELKEEGLATLNLKLPLTKAINFGTINLNGEYDIKKVARQSNINTASKEDLESLSGLGSSLAQKIIDNRPYENIAELKSISGIGDKIYEEIRDDVAVDSNSFKVELKVSIAAKGINKDLTETLKIN